MTAPKLTFKPAVRAAVKLKVLIDGPSGSGKTFGALALAEGIVGDGKIALIDSEHERASFYADRYRFDSLALTDFHPDRYVEAIDAAIAAGYGVVVLDSLTHAWQNVLQRKEQHERDNPRANQFTMWGLFTPAWERLIQHILQVPVHVICTARSKQAYEQSEANGRKQVVKLGLQPQVRDGTEYEFGLVFSLEQTHKAQATKDNTNLFPPRTELLDLADGKVAHALSQWLTTAKPVAAPEAETVSAINAEIAKLPEAQQARARQKWAQQRLVGVTEDEAQGILSKLLAAGEKGAPASAAPAAAVDAPAPVASKRLPPPPVEVIPPRVVDPAPSAEPEPACPKCGSVGMKDMRKTKSNPKAPDYRCQAKKCDGVLWPGQWPPKTDPAQGDLMDGDAAEGEAGAGVGAGVSDDGLDGGPDDLPF